MYELEEKRKEQNFHHREDKDGILEQMRTEGDLLLTLVIPQRGLKASGDHTLCHEHLIAEETRILAVALRIHPTIQRVCKHDLAPRLVRLVARAETRQLDYLAKFLCRRFVCRRP